VLEARGLAGKVGDWVAEGVAGGVGGVLQAASNAAKTVAERAAEPRNEKLCIELEKFMAKKSENEDCGTGCRQVNPIGLRK
jgi:hypothetical protein